MSIFKDFLHKKIHMWDDYDKASDMFNPPISHFYFGRWTKYGGLPVWRRGCILHIGKHGQYKNEDDKQWYGAWAKHQVWDKDFLRTCSKFGRWWRKFIKPTYQLPIWLAFYSSNGRAIMKTKYDSWRYEFPPQFCLVFFGLCFAWWLSAPVASTDHTYDGVLYPNNDAYWESMLEYISHKNEDGLAGVIKKYIGVTYVRKYSSAELEKIDKLNAEREANKYEYNTPEYENWWKRREKIHGVIIYQFILRPEYIKKEHINEYNDALKEVKRSKKYKDKYFLD